MSQSCRSAARTAPVRASSAGRQDWETAEALTQRARASWERGRWLHSCLGSQADVEQIDSRFDCLAPYYGEARDFSAACISLRGQLRALRRAHGWGLRYFV